MVCTSDSGMKLYEIEEYSDHEYITGYHAWNVTYFIDVIYGADMHYYISMKRGFIMTPETEIVKKQILFTYLGLVFAFFCFLFCLKNCFNNAPHSSSKMPPIVSG